MKGNPNIIRSVLNLLRAVICYSLISLASLLSHFFVSRMLESPLEDGRISLQLVYFYSAIFYYVFFFCFTRLFALYAVAFRKECPLCQERAPRLFVRIGRLFKSQVFVIHFSATLALLLLTRSRAYGYLARAVFGEGATDDQIYLAALFTVPLLMITFIASYLFAARSIRKESAVLTKRRTQKANSHLVVETVKLTLNTVSAAVAIPLVILLASTFVVFLVAFPCVIAVALAFIVLRYLRALRIRRRFIRQLKKACESRRHRLSAIKRPYLSLLFLNDGANFTLTTDGKTYSCKLVHAIKRNVPMFFHADGYGTVTNTISVFRIDIAHYVTSFQYAFDADNEKIVIVCPIPKAMFSRREGASAAVDTSVTEAKFIYAGIGKKGTRSNVLKELPSEGGVSREMDVGEYFAGYYFYNGSGFLNAIERGVLAHQ